MNKKINTLVLLIGLIFCFSTEGAIVVRDNSEESSCTSLDLRRRVPSPLTDFRLHKFTRGNIIYIFGSSTSGKSTLLRRLSELRPDFKFISTRDMKQVFLLKTLHMLFPDEMNVLLRSYNPQTIIPLVFGDRRFDKGILEEYSKRDHRGSEALKIVNSRLDDLHTVYPTSSSYMCNFYEFFFAYIFTLSKNGKTVVIDNVWVDKFHTYKMKYFYHAPVFYVLNYLSPLLFHKRVSIRNESSAHQGDPINIRSFMRPVETFLSLYGKKGGILIDTIPRETLHKSLYFLYEESKKQSIPNRLIDEDFSTLSKTFDREFGESEYLPIYCKYPFDILFNSGDTSPPTNAERFLSLKDWETQGSFD